MADQRLLWLLAQAEEHELSTAQVAVLSMLLALDARDRAQITKAQLGDLVKLKERQVANVLKELEGHVAAFIKKQRAGGAGKGRAANSYAIRPDATSNPVPAAWYLQQSSAGNAVPSASPDQHSNTGNEVLVACELPPEIPPLRDNQTPLELNLQAVELEASSGKPPAKVLNGRATSMLSEDLADIIVEHVNSRWLDPTKAAGLDSSHPRIKVWMQAGADFDSDILPTIVTVCARPHKKAIGSWTYFDQPIAEAIERRRAAETAAFLVTPAEVNTHDQSPSTLGNLDIRRGKVGPGSAHYLRSIAKCQSDEQRRVESVAGK